MHERARTSLMACPHIMLVAPGGIGHRFGLHAERGEFTRIVAVEHSLKISIVGDDPNGLKIADLVGLADGGVGATSRGRAQGRP